VYTLAVNVTACCGASGGTGQLTIVPPPVHGGVADCTNAPGGTGMVTVVAPEVVAPRFWTVIV
jgi:hypothetical protein